MSELYERYVPNHTLVVSLLERLEKAEKENKDLKLMIRDLNDVIAKLESELKTIS